MTYCTVGGATVDQSLLRPLKLHGKAVFAGALAVTFCLLIGLRSGFAGSVSGDVHGFTLNPQGAPLPGVDVQVHSLEDNSDRNIVSNDQGVFVVENLKPGRYQLKASKAGLGSSPVTIVRLASQQDLRVDMTLVASVGSMGALNPGPTADLHTPAEIQNLSGTPLTEREKLLLERLDRLEQRLAALEAKEASAVTPSATPLQSAPATSQAMTSSATVAIAPPAPSTSASTGSPTAQSAPPASEPKAAPATVALAKPVSATPVGGGSLSDSVPAKPLLVASLGGSAGMPSPAQSSTLTPPSGLVAALVPSLAVLPSTSKPNVTVNAPVAAAPQAAPEQKTKIEPFSDADWTWLNGNPRTKDIYWDTKFFTPEIRADVNYTWDNQHPQDHTMGGSSEIFRAGEVQLEQLGVGGDFHFANVRARLMTQFGMYSETTPRNDASPGNGAWDLDTAYRYVSEAYGGYHFDVMHGINVDAGIFMSYIGLFSYYNFDNWAYQPSYVSSNTPWFFNGVRIQIFPTAHLKIEPWFINGWQSYASANNRPGLGGQIKWTPFSWINIISNEYGLGHDDLYTPGRARIHTDNSIEIKYFDRPQAKALDKMAFTFTGDLGCEYGGGVSCTGDHAGGYKQSFIGGMLYNRWWFRQDKYAVTLGGGGINNPGRYLVLIPPINGETAASAAINSPYFTENPGDKFKAWDSSLTLDWMPRQYITFRVEGDYRHSSVPYWSGRGGINPPAFLGASTGTPNGFPTEYACNDGTPSLTNGKGACANNGGLWSPDLVKDEFLIDFDILVKF